MANNTQYTPHDLVLLNFFVEKSGSLVLGPEYSNVFTVQALVIAQEVPFLMHAMLALSACHLLHSVPDKRPYQLAEALHAQLGSQGLRQAIAHMNSAKDMDSVFTTAMLLNCLAFCYADWREDESEPQRTRPSWQWVRIQTGIRDLIMETKPFHSESIWMPMFIASDMFAITDPPDTTLDAQLADFCGITPDSTSVENVYFEFHEQLAPLVARETDLRYIRMYTRAFGGVDLRYIKLLEQEDTKALMLFVH